MTIYLAGGVTGNLNAEWRRAAERERERMKLYLVGNHPLKQSLQISKIGGGHRILESYYYIKDNPWFAKILPLLDDFLLDSGAFTFMQGSHDGPIDWDKYIEDYAEFINRYDVRLFFNLDIELVSGIPESERLRAKLERLTGKQPIVVWHHILGLDYFKQLCKNYPYVAISGVVEGIARVDYEKIFPWFIGTAHDAGIKIHGLGYTDVAGLHKYHFDSVDSTAWLYGNRGGYIMIFDEKIGNFKKITTQQGQRLKSRDAALFNYREWQKFQLYAERNL